MRNLLYVLLLAPLALYADEGAYQEQYQEQAQAQYHYGPNNAPALAATNCIGSTSVGVGPLSFGYTKSDKGCAALRDAEYLRQHFGDEAATARVCQHRRLRKALKKSGVLDCKAVYK